MTSTVDNPASRARASAIGWSANPRGSNRPRRGRMAAAVLAMVVCAWLAISLFTSAGNRKGQLVVARPVPRFHAVTRDDFRVVRVAADSGSSLVSSSQLNDVVGRVAATDLTTGSFLSNNQLLPPGKSPIGANEAVVGTQLATSDSPTTLPVGAHVLVIIRPPSGSIDSEDSTVHGWILEVNSVDQASGGGREVSLVVPVDSAHLVSAAAADDRVSVVVLGGS